MDSYSVSFTLGKASAAHGANINHNNRKFIAANIQQERSVENITYAMQDVIDAYHQLFDDALAEYNAKQTRPCRRIQDYYAHIAASKREEAYYEIVVQFGDSKTAPCGSMRGDIAKTMLGEYMKSFRERNPNLHVFNAVLHMDEASPHLHIDFIPVYRNSRTRFLSTGVSMRAALIEQGFHANGQQHNQLVAWEASERQVMEAILHQHGYVREDKSAQYAHMTVEEYKQSQDAKHMAQLLREMHTVTHNDTTTEAIRQLRTKLLDAEHRAERLELEKRSPYKSFFYSLPEKQAFVQAKLDELHIPYRETENGFEAQECYLAFIRKLEKEYKAPHTNARETLREAIDRLLMQSETFEDFLTRLENEQYSIKRGKFISVKPKNGERYIRLKSLGEQYSEFALKNRLVAKQDYEKKLTAKLEDAKKCKSPNAVVLRTMQFYTLSFSKGVLPMRKRDKQKPFAWTNDAQLDALLLLNQKINSGASLETLRSEFESAEQAAAHTSAALREAERSLKAYYELKEKIEIVFEGKHSAAFTVEQAQQTLKGYPTITQFNYRNIEQLIEKGTDEVRQAATADAQAQQKLHEADALLTLAEQVRGGTYVQALVASERLRRESEVMPNGTRPVQGG